MPENLTIEEALQYHFKGVGLKSKSCIVVIPKPEVLHSANSISADTLLEYFTVKYSENELLKKKEEHTIDILKLFMRELAKTNSLGQLIEFVTGSESIPVSGRFEPALEIQFEHQKSDFFLKPRSSNNHILHLPAELGIHDLLVKLEKAFEFKD